jgi:hypothetical protein
MRLALTLLFLTFARGALACANPICIVEAESLALTRVITFENTYAGHGPGQLVNGVLVLDGAQFGEYFAGQTLAQRGDFDQVSGAGLNPLTLLAADKDTGLSLVFMSGNTVLNGYGAAGFPRRHAQGEGAMAWLFDEDQSAISFQLRGGEGGQAQAAFLRRDGSQIATLNLGPLGEGEIGFARADGIGDIAGVVVTNTDPQGLALDNIRFGRAPDLS